MCIYIYIHTYTYVHIHTYTKNMIWIVPCRWLLGCLQVLLPTTMLEELLNHLQELHQADSERRAGAGRTWETGLRCSTLLRCSTFGWFHWFTTHYQWIYIYIYLSHQNFRVVISNPHCTKETEAGGAQQLRILPEVWFCAAAAQDKNDSGGLVQIFPRPEPCRKETHSRSEHTRWCLMWKTVCYGKLPICRWLPIKHGDFP